jgi:hypothetical protein
MKSSNFWDLTPCSLLKVSRRFGVKSLLNLQGSRVDLYHAMWDLKFSQRWLWRVSSSEIWRCVVRRVSTRYVPPKRRVESLRTTQRHIPEYDTLLYHAVFLLGLLFNSEDEGDIFLRNVRWLSTDYAALYSRRYNSWNYTFSRSQWPRRVRHEMSSPAQAVGSWVRIPLEAWISVFMLSCICSGLMTGWASVQWVLPTVYKINNFIINSELEQAREPNPSR